ncbi:MAG: GTP-binding protein [Oceanospirillaceae bacterium]|nr:GTP-binding protein [Oceanospirillaceae bacterium]
MQISKAIPTNVITGFLGVGKTTVINSLLANKPAGEKWAVLVNEFGEIGVDGSLLENNQTGEGEISIREVPGGCMCCAAGLPMQVALNQLIAKTKPDHLIIEPTGLGHPAEILAALSQPFFRSVIDIKATLCLVDARKVSDERYREHPVFQQQLQVADIIVASKTDLYGAADIEQLKTYLALLGLEDVPVYGQQQGKLDVNWLAQHSAFKTPAKPLRMGLTVQPHHPMENTPGDLPAAGYEEKTRQADGFISIGWRISAQQIFNREKILQLFARIAAVRAKAVMHCEQGYIAFNQVDGITSELNVDAKPDSRIEFIVPEDAALPGWVDIQACLKI